MPGASERLLTVVYSSAATDGLGSVDLAELLAESRIRNHARGITGMLLAENDRFLQALEGPEDEVRDLMASITADPRHRDVRILVEEVDPGRRFPDWAMAHHDLRDPTAVPSADPFAALLEARGELPAAPTRSARVLAWFHGGPLRTGAR